MTMGIAKEEREETGQKEKRDREDPSGDAAGDEPERQRAENERRAGRIQSQIR